MSIASEFKEFAMKGNVVDMAVGIIVGGVVMPPIGTAIGGASFSEPGTSLGVGADGKTEVLLGEIRDLLKNR